MAPLGRKPPRLSREGYIIALELYGCEDNLRSSLKSKVSLFNKWGKQNPEDLELCRSYANSLGYDWERGSVTKDGFYTSFVRATAAGGPPMYDFNNPPSFEDLSGRPRDISQVIQAEDVSKSVGEEPMTSDPNGRFAAMNWQQANALNSSQLLHNRTVNFQTPESTLRSLTVLKHIPSVLQGAPGNLQFVPGEDQKNALGAASIAYVALTVLRGVADGSKEITTDDMANIKTMLNYVGEEDMKKFVKGFQADLNSVLTAIRFDHSELICWWSIDETLYMKTEVLVRILENTVWRLRHAMSFLGGASPIRHFPNGYLPLIEHADSPTVCEHQLGSFNMPSFLDSLMDSEQASHIYENA